MNSRNFSVIIQGPVIGKPGEAYSCQGTMQCIESIRKVLPEAEVIISTWEGTDVSHLKYDKLVINKDPGAITYNDYELKGINNNTNRQIVSTYNGLSQATREYSIKFRADFRLASSNFFSYLNKFSEHRRFQFFSQRIIVPILASRDPAKIPILYSISDLIQIGRTKDLQDLWNIPLQPEPATTRAYDYFHQFKNDPLRFNQYKMRFSAEQYIWYAFAKKKGLDLSIDYYCHIPTKIIIPSVISIVDNFQVLDIEQIGITPPGRLVHSLNTMITNSKWKVLYQKICIDKSSFFLYKESFKICSRSLSFYFKNKIKSGAIYKVYQSFSFKKEN